MQYGSSNGPKQNILPNAIVQEDNANWSILHNAVASGDDKSLQILLAGGNVDRTVKESKHGNTPLHEAAWRGYSRCVRLLCTPISKTKPSGSIGQNKKLKGIVLETRNALHSTLLGIKNDQGFTALHLAAQNGHNQSCREMLLAGGDPDLQNYYGDTPLHTACRYGHAGAARILLSASCDPNKVNLNGDAPLHITCAMGRRKLTRILLEAECDMNVKNAQGERPRDIAIRKNYGEILDILNNPHQIRNRRGKQNSNSNGNGTAKPNGQRRSSKSNQMDGVDGVPWSPYGCHYFPDPRSFPPPKLETLPKEPLKKGEQYYLDLAGNIRKGPIGIGNTCYCGPFFRHIEDKINCNHKHLKKYVHRAKETLGNKVQELAIRTNDQIEQLTRSMIADRIRCESRRLYLDQYLRRGDPQRMTAEQVLRSKWKQQNADGRLARCRSLELLDNDESIAPYTLPNSKSCELLEETIAIVHNVDEQASNAAGDDRSQDESISERSPSSLGNLAKGDMVDSCSISRRLENLMEETSKIFENDRDPTEEFRLSLRDSVPNEVAAGGESGPDKRIKQSTYSNDPDQPNSSSMHHIYVSNVLRERKPHYDSSNASNRSQVSYNWELEEPSSSLSNTEKNETMVRNVMSALYKDNQRIATGLADQTVNENEESTWTDKLSYKGDQAAMLNANENFQENYVEETNGNARSSNDLAAFVEAPTERQNMPSYAQLNKIKRPQGEVVELIPPPQSRNIDWHYKAKNNNFEQTQSIENSTKKVEIKSSEIKSLKKRNDKDNVKRSKVQELVARLQGKLTIGGLHKHRPAETVRADNVSTIAANSDSESSEDEQNNHNENQCLAQSNSIRQIQMPDRFTGCVTASPIQPQVIKENVISYVAMATSKVISQKIIEPSHEINRQQSPGVQLPLTNLPGRVIPKDAYFHELPHKRRYGNGTPTSSVGHACDVGVREIRQQAFCNSQQQLDMYSTRDRIDLPSIASPHSLQNYQMLCNSPSLQPNIQSMSPQGNLPSPHSFPSPGSEVSRISGDHETTVIKNMDPTQKHFYSQSNYMPMSLPMQESCHGHVERDISNDSGFSTRESYRPSPNILVHGHYTSNNIGIEMPATMISASQNNNNNIEYAIADNSALSGHIENSRAQMVEYNFGNVSSLV